jgi:hypothetical protein
MKIQDFFVLIKAESSGKRKKAEKAFLIKNCFIAARVAILNSCVNILFAQDLQTREKHMGRKFLILVVLAFSGFVFLPSETKAETINDKSSAVGELSARPLFQRGRRNRGQNRNWKAWRRAENRNLNRNRRGFRLVRQTYWRNGRRYTRVIRVY